jgi:hypothetical protein
MLGAKDEATDKRLNMHDATPWLIEQEARSAAFSQPHLQSKGGRPHE